MMHLLTFKVLSIVLIFIVTLIAGIYPFKERSETDRKHDFPKAEALACGVFLGAGLIHMLGDAASDFIALGYDYPFAFLIAGVTFLFLLWLEHIGREYYHHRGGDTAFFAVLATIMLSIHSFLVGSALGLSDHLYMAVLIMVAILGHKWAASFALAVQINKTNLSFAARATCFGVFATMVPLGVMLGSLITHHFNHPELEAVFLSLAAGTFLYLGTLHGLAKAVMVQGCCNLRHYTLVILGFTLMAVVAVWA